MKKLINTPTLFYIAAVLFDIAAIISFVGESSLMNRVGQQQEISRLRAEIDEYKNICQEKVILN